MSEAPISDPPRVVAVVQARLGSVRFPRKVLSEIDGRPALQVLCERLSEAQSLDEVVLAVPDDHSNFELVDLASDWGLRCFSGSEKDVLQRFTSAAVAADAAVVVRITGDCPMIDSVVVDFAVAAFWSKDAIYVRTDASYPDGFDVEVCSVASLITADREATEPDDREHVMPYVRKIAGTRAYEVSRGERSDLRVTLDEPADLDVIRRVFAHFGSAPFGVEDVLELCGRAPDVFAANQHLVRDEGAQMSEGEKLWRRAKEVIPGGNMLLSKRAEQFLPDGWPSYFSRAKGCEVWDLEGRHFFDVSLMGVGTNILGYGHPKVDEAVRKVIDKGNLSTLNCPEEVYLAERLCELHPWADMAKFARSGGEACAIAVRIARAASGKPAVAICGYHGWHDWYLSANLADDAALDGHLLPGLTPNGVPRELLGLTRPFFYNDLEALKDILSAGDVGTVFMEVERSSPPAPGFLEGVRQLTKQHGCVLIFDECTSGFRQLVGGHHMVYGIEPDIATFGKTLGNGYAITAVIGRREVMTSAESTFISSTFWTERIGPAAALATLTAMEEEDAPRRVHEIGGEIRKIWEAVTADLGLKSNNAGLSALTTLGVEGWDPRFAKQELLRRMLKRGYLSGLTVYATISHTPEVLAPYALALGDVLWEIDNVLMSNAVSKKSSHGVDSFGRLA
jgi:glutamate-1-semialdehyde 2,1-aminomutase